MKNPKKEYFYGFTSPLSFEMQNKKILENGYLTLMGDDQLKIPDFDFKLTHLCFTYITPSKKGI